MTMRVSQAPGIVVRQATDGMLESQIASALSNMVQPSRDDELERTQGNLGNVAQELVRRTEILGTAIHHIAENAGHNTRKVTADIQKWEEQIAYHLMQSLQELDQIIPRGEVIKAIGGSATGYCINN